MPSVTSSNVLPYTSAKDFYLPSLLFFFLALPYFVQPGKVLAKMRVNGAVATALYSSALLLGNVRADDAEEADAAATTIEEATTTSILEKPTFTVSYASTRRCRPTAK